MHGVSLRRLVVTAGLVSSLSVGGLALADEPVAAPGAAGAPAEQAGGAGGGASGEGQVAPEQGQQAAQPEAGAAQPEAGNAETGATEATQPEAGSAQPEAPAEQPSAGAAQGAGADSSTSAPADQAAAPAPQAPAQQQAAAPAASAASTADAAASSQTDKVTDGAAQVTDAAGTATQYRTLAEALAAAKDGETVTLLKPTAEAATLDKAVTLTAADGATFGGTLTVNAAGATVTGVSFVLGAASNGTSSVTLNAAATVSGNAFLIDGTASDQLQLNCVAVKSGASGAQVSGNTFTITSYDVNATSSVNDRVAVNLIGNAGGPSDVSVSGNQLFGAGDQYQGLLVMATGNSGVIGGLSITDNTVGAADGSDAGSDPANSGLRGVVLGGNVDGATISGNAFNSGKFAVHTYLYGAYAPNRNVTISSNYINTAAGLVVADGSADASVKLDTSSNTFGDAYVRDGVAEVNGKAYKTLQEAVDAANAGDTVTVTGDVRGATKVTKQVSIVSDGDAKVFDGIDFEAGSDGSSVSGLTFITDETSAADTQFAVNVKSASGVTVSGNTFSIAGSVAADGQGQQPSAVRLQWGADNTTVEGNVFDLTTGGSDRVAVNLMGNVTNTTVSSNTMTALQGATDGQVWFMIAMGWKEPNISNLAITGNNVDANGCGSVYGAGLSVTNNVDITGGNTFTGLQKAVCAVTWTDGDGNKQGGKNSGVTVSQNLFDACDTAVYFNTDGVTGAGVTVDPAVEAGGSNRFENGTKPVDGSYFALGALSYEIVDRNGNPISDAPTDLTASLPTEYTLLATPLPDLAWDTHDFVGWKVKGASDAPQASFVLDPSKLSGDVTLQAVFGADVAVNETTGKTYDSLKAAVEEASAGDTVKLVADTAESVTVTKPLNLTAAGGATAHGSIRLAKGADGSVVSGVHFALDGQSVVADGRVLLQSVIVSGANNVQVTGNDFVVAPDKADQNSAVWVEGKTDGTVVSGNTFTLPPSANNSSNVGVNLVGGASDGVANITNTTVSGNTVNASGDVDGDSDADEASLLVANGNVKDAGTFGVSGLTVTGNVVNAGGDASSNRVCGVIFGNVADATVSGNTFSNVYYSVGYSAWPGEGPSDRVTVSGNTMSGLVGTFWSSEFALNAGTSITVSADNTYGDITYPVYGSYFGPRTISYVAVDEQGNPVSAEGFDAGANPSEYYEQTPAFALSAPTAPAGYDFVGWRLAATDAAQPDLTFDAFGLRGDQSVQAVFKKHVAPLPSGSKDSGSSDKDSSGKDSSSTDKPSSSGKDSSSKDSSSVDKPGSSDKDSSSVDQSKPSDSKDSSSVDRPSDSKDSSSSDKPSTSPDQSQDSDHNQTPGTNPGGNGGSGGNGGTTNPGTNPGGTVKPNGNGGTTAPNQTAKPNTMPKTGDETNDALVAAAGVAGAAALAGAGVLVVRRSRHQGE